MKYRLGDLLYIKGRIGWKGLKKKEYLDKGDYRIINGTNIINGKVNWSSCGFISKERYNESPEIMLKANDILITKDGTIGKVAIVEELSKPSTVASGIFILRNTSPNIWITKYLYYYLQSYDFKSFIHSRIEGSVIPHLYQKDFESLSIKSPSLEEQNTISRRLELIDKKIDLNNQLNDNLDALLTNIFKKYMINDGFEKSNLTQIANYKNGLAMQKYRPNSNEESLPVLKIKELNQGNTDDSSDRCSANLDNSVIVNTGDIIFSWSGTLLVKNWTGDKAGLNQHLFKVTSNKYPAWFIYEWTKYHLLRFQAIAAGKATTMGHIKRSDLKSSLVYIPSQLFLAKMDSQLAPIYSQRLNLIKENQQLSKLKQTLLKKYF